MSPGVPVAGLKHAGRFLAMLTLFWAPSDACATGPPRQARHVISYLTTARVEGQFITEWRIFDPVTRSDTLFGQGTYGGVYWDTAETSV